MRVRREVCDEEDLTGEEGVSDNVSNCGGLRNEKEMWIIEEDLKKAESALQIGDKPMYDPSYINELNSYLTKVAGNILKNVMPKEGLSKVDKLMMLNKMIDCEINQDTHFKIDFAREDLQSNSKQSRDTIDALRWSHGASSSTVRSKCSLLYHLSERPFDTNGEWTPSNGLRISGAEPIDRYK